MILVVRSFFNSLDCLSAVFRLTSGTCVLSIGGFQLLHAVYLVERFLHGLYVRRCKFDIVFFRKHEQLAISPTVRPQDRAKFRLAREVVIHHLMVHRERYQPVALRLFDSTADPSFLTYLANAGNYFVMCHDGGDGGISLGQHLTAAQQLERKRRDFLYPADRPERGNGAQAPETLALRATIIAFIERGLGVALINSVEFRDTKVGDSN